MTLDGQAALGCHYQQGLFVKVSSRSFAGANTVILCKAYLNGGAIAVLLLKCHKPAVDFLCLCFWNVVQSISEDGPCPLVFLDLLLKLRKLDEELLLHHDKTGIKLISSFRRHIILIIAFSWQQAANYSCFDTSEQIKTACPACILSTISGHIQSKPFEISSEWTWNDMQMQRPNMTGTDTYTSKIPLHFHFSMAIAAWLLHHLLAGIAADA